MKNEKGKNTKQVFTKMQIVRSEKYFKYKDLLTAILKDNETYSTEDVDTKINEFLKRRYKVC